MAAAARRSTIQECCSLLLFLASSATECHAAIGSKDLESDIARLRGDDRSMSMLQRSTVATRSVSHPQSTKSSTPVMVPSATANAIANLTSPPTNEQLITNRVSNKSSDMMHALMTNIAGVPSDATVDQRKIPTADQQKIPDWVSDMASDMMGALSSDIARVPWADNITGGGNRSAVRFDVNDYKLDMHVGSTTLPNSTEIDLQSQNVSIVLTLNLTAAADPQVVDRFKQAKGWLQQSDTARMLAKQLPKDIARKMVKAQISAFPLPKSRTGLMILKADVLVRWKPHVDDKTKEFSFVPKLNVNGCEVKGTGGMDSLTYASPMICRIFAKELVDISDRMGPQVGRLTSEVSKQLVGAFAEDAMREIISLSIGQQAD